MRKLDDHRQEPTDVANRMSEKIPIREQRMQPRLSTWPIGGFQSCAGCLLLLPHPSAGEDASQKDAGQRTQKSQDTVHGFNIVA